MLKMMRLFALVGVAAGLTACGTLTTGTSQSIAVMTEPAGATCELRRNGDVIAVVNPTPGTANISKSTRDIAVDCTRDGSLPAATVVPASFQPMTAGNILIGGVVGLAVDAASGALAQYPSNVVVVLPPRTFSSPAERDLFFSNREAEIRKRAADRLAAAASACTPGNPAHCESQKAAVTADMEAELARLNAQRAAATTSAT
jgi:hypothetical protein